MIKTLYSFDFDDTLFHTPRMEEGKSIWEEKTGLTWPYNGWWSKAETIDTDIFWIPKNEFVYRKYLEAISDETGASILATGRLNKVPGMRENIDKILRLNNISFDEINVINQGNGTGGVYLNWGGDTYNFKTKLFEELIELTSCEHFVMYDDRHEHLVRFEEWAKEQNCKITVFDIKNKTEKVF
jgi:hypothetical protein